MNREIGLKCRDLCKENNYTFKFLNQKIQSDKNFIIWHLIRYLKNSYYFVLLAM